MKSFVVLSASLACVIVACSGANPTEIFDPIVTTPTHQPDSSVPDVQADAPDADASVDACTPETNAQFCARTNSNCNLFATADNCGNVRDIVNCGMCGKQSFCLDGKCTACVPKNCKDQGFNCGQASDTCNPAPLECGVCKVTENCTNNVCAIKPPVCVPNTDIALCQAAGYSCGSLVTIDNCGGQRNIPECSLGHILSCPPAVGALCIAHMCCMPLTDASLCASAAKVCGSLDVTDCEIPRHVVSCGVCVGAKVCQPNGTCL